MSDNLPLHRDARHASVTSLSPPLLHELTTARSKSLDIPSLVIHNFQWHTYRKPTKCENCDQTMTGFLKQGLQCKRCEINVHAKCQYDLIKPCVQLIPGEHHFCLKTYKKPKYCDFCHKLLAGLHDQGYRCSECGTNVHEKCRFEIEKGCEKTLEARKNSQRVMLSPREDLKPLKVDWDEIQKVLSDQEIDSSLEVSPSSSAYSISSGTTSSPAFSLSDGSGSNYSSDYMNETYNIIIEEEEEFAENETTLKDSSKTNEITNEEQEKLLRDDVDESKRNEYCKKCKILTAISITLAVSVSLLTVLVFYLVKSK